MKRFGKLLALLMICVLAASCVAGCSKSNENDLITASKALQASDLDASSKRYLEGFLLDLKGFDAYILDGKAGTLTTHIDSSGIPAKLTLDADFATAELSLAMVRKALTDNDEKFERGTKSKTDYDWQLNEAKKYYQGRRPEILAIIGQYVANHP